MFIRQLMATGLASFAAGALLTIGSPHFTAGTTDSLSGPSPQIHGPQLPSAVAVDRIGPSPAMALWQEAFLLLGPAPLAAQSLTGPTSPPPPPLSDSTGEVVAFFHQVIEHRQSAGAAFRSAADSFAEEIFAGMESLTVLERGGARTHDDLRRAEAAAELILHGAVGLGQTIHDFLEGFEDALRDAEARLRSIAVEAADLVQDARNQGRVGRERVVLKERELTAFIAVAESDGCDLLDGAAGCDPKHLERYYLIMQEASSARRDAERSDMIVDQVAAAAGEADRLASHAVQERLRVFKERIRISDDLRGLANELDAARTLWALEAPLLDYQALASTFDDITAHAFSVPGEVLAAFPRISFGASGVTLFQEARNIAVDVAQLRNWAAEANADLSSDGGDR